MIKVSGLCDMVKNIGTASLVERYGGIVDSPPMSHGVSVFSLGDYHGSKTKLSFGTHSGKTSHPWSIIYLVTSSAHLFGQRITM